MLELSTGSAEEPKYFTDSIENTSERPQTSSVASRMQHPALTAKLTAELAANRKTQQTTTDDKTILEAQRELQKTPTDKPGRASRSWGKAEMQSSTSSLQKNINTKE